MFALFTIFTQLEMRVQSIRASEVLSVWNLEADLLSTSIALFLNDAIKDSPFFPQRFLEHSLLYFEVFKWKLFYQIDEAITEAFFVVDFLLATALFRPLNVLHPSSWGS